ncbi:Serine/threonine-protein phosphatase 1 regulatory subunit 10, partial [Trichinella zimbabwensis]
LQNEFFCSCFIADFAKILFLVLMPPKAKKLQSSLDMICTPGITLVNDARGIAASGSATDFVQCMRNASTWAVRMIFLSSIKDTAEEDRKKILEAGAWDLLLTWLIEGEKSENWEFLSKLLQLFIDLPVYVDLLKSNSTPKLIKRLSKRTNISTEVRNLSVDIVMIWKDIIMDEINVKGAEVCKRTVCPTLELGSPTAAVSVPSTSALLFPSLESSSTSNSLPVEPAIRTPNLSCSAKSSATAGIPCIVVAPRGRGKPVKPIFSDQKKDDLVKLNKIDLADAEQSVEVKDELLPVKPAAVKPIETRKKTAKTYPIKLRSTGLEEEVPMPKIKRTRLEKNDSTDVEQNVDDASAVNENKPTDTASTSGTGQVKTKTKGSLLLDSGGFEAALGVVSAPKVMVTKRKKTTPKVATSKSTTNSSEPVLEKPDLLQLERSSCEVTSSSSAVSHADSCTGRKSALSGKKKSKPYRVTWAPDDELVSINYFELEPDERVNVSKFQGHGDDLKHVEMLQERELLRTRWTSSHGEDLDLPEISGISTDNSSNSPSWKLLPISGISEAKKVAVCSEEKMRWDETKLNPLPSIFYSTQTGIVDAPKETEVERSSGNHSTTKTIPLIAEGAPATNPKITSTGSSQQSSAVNVVPGFRKSEFDFNNQPPVTVSGYQYSNSTTPVDSHQPNMAGAPPLNFPLNPNARPYGPLPGTSAFPAPRKMMMPRAGPPGLFNGPMRVGPPVDMKGIPAGRGFGGPNGEPAPPMNWNAPPQPNCSSLGLLGHAPVEPPFSHGRGRASFMPPGPGGRFANPAGGFRAPRAGGGPAGAAGVTGIQRPPCVFFQRGCCGFGDRCRFPHIK